MVERHLEATDLMRLPCDATRHFAETEALRKELAALRRKDRNGTPAADDQGHPSIGARA